MRLAILFLVLCSLPALARERIWGWCEQGGQLVTVLGYTSSPLTPIQRSYPVCTVTVFLAGTGTHATLFADNSGTSLANPFTLGVSPETGSNGYWFFYVDNGRYDLQFSGGGIPTPFTLRDVLAQDGGGGGGGSGTLTTISVGNLAPLFTSSVANPTTTPAVTFSLTSGSANNFFATPNGSSGPGAYRTIVGADLPASGVVAGVYTCVNATVDATGRVTAISNGTCGGGGGGLPYTQSFSIATTVNITAITHGKGLWPVVTVYDNSTPANLMLAAYTVAANGDLVVNFSATESGTVVVK